jgi:uncharacterized protein YdeI (YjbR/CyaY-like superfamily)
MTKRSFAEFEADSRAAWRHWLADHHDRESGVWLTWHTKASGHQRISLDEAVGEAICFGWIDSTLRRLGGGRSALLFTPRRPGSNWSRRNKQRVAKLLANGLMTDAGRRAVDAAKRAGSWTALDGVEDLQVPDDLSNALAACPPAQRNFSVSSPSTRKLALAWIHSAKRPATRANRIAETVRLAAENRSIVDRSRSPRDG